MPVFWKKLVYFYGPVFGVFDQMNDNQKICNDFTINEFDIPPMSSTKFHKDVDAHVLQDENSVSEANNYSGNGSTVIFQDSYTFLLILIIQRIKKLTKISNVFNATRNKKCDASLTMHVEMLIDFAEFFENKSEDFI